jgi:hypothetical protein
MVKLQWRSPKQHCKSAVAYGEVVVSSVDSYSARLILAGQLLGVRREEAKLNTPDGKTPASPPATQSPPAEHICHCHHATESGGSEEQEKEQRNKPWSGKVLLSLIPAPCRCSGDLLPCFFPSLCRAGKLCSY